MRKVIGLCRAGSTATTFPKLLQNDFDGVCMAGSDPSPCQQGNPHNYFDERDYQFVSTYRRSWTLIHRIKASACFD